MISIQKNFNEPTMPVDEQQFYGLVRATRWNELIDSFRQTGDQAQKRKLPAFIFQATFDETTSKNGRVGRWRKQAATRLTGLVVMDIDHVDAPRETWERIDNEQLTIDNELRKRILLVYITPSGKGLKIVFKARTDWGNLIDNQHAMAQLLGVEVDESCKDASRMSFICKEEDILFIDKELFTYENQEFAQKYNEEYRKGKSGQTKSPSPSPQVGTLSSDCVSTPKGEGNQTADGAPLWHGHSIQSIIDMRYADKLPCAADSNRHNESLKLASDLLILLDGDRQQTLQVLKAQPWVQEIIQERNENVEQTVASAAERMAEREKKYLTQAPSKAMQEAIQKVTQKTYQELTQAPAQTVTALQREDEMAQWLWDWGEAFWRLTEAFPILKDIFKGLKRNQFPAAFFVAGGFMMTLMTRCFYRFYYRPEEKRRLNNCTLIIGDPASGKSFATRLYKLLAAPIVEADKVGRDAINAYRELMKTKGANKEKPKKPKVIVRIHPARTSNAQFIQDMVNAVEVVDGEEMQLHMLTFDTELDNTVMVQKGGSWIDKMSMELKAFHNEEDGQAYSNADSVMQNFRVTWNYVYTGTPIALKKKVNDTNFGSGLFTRLTCIPMPSTHFQMIERETTMDFDSDARLKQWAVKLDRMKGELPMQRIVDELYDWTARRMEDAKENHSEADELILKRCAYHGLNFAAPFIVMRHWDALHQEGEFWCGEFQTDDVDWQLVELIVNIQLACQRYFFGAMADRYYEEKRRDQAVNGTHKSHTITAFENLPQEFTTEDVMRCFGLTKDDAVYKRIERLTEDHLAVKMGTFKINGKLRAKYRKMGAMIL